MAKNCSNSSNKNQSSNTSNSGGSNRSKNQNKNKSQNSSTNSNKNANDFIDIFYSMCIIKIVQEQRRSDHRIGAPFFVYQW